MASRMYLYRADYDVGKEHRVRFFYARNARVGKEFCKLNFAEKDEKINRLVLKKFGYMRDDIGTTEAAFMKPNKFPQGILGLKRFLLMIRYCRIFTLRRPRIRLICWKINIWLL